MTQDSGEFGERGQLGTMLIYGNPRSGKSSTAARKVEEAFLRGCAMSLICVDPHARKAGSLWNRIKAYEDRLLRPAASSEEEIITALEWFMGEFEHRLSDDG